MYTLSEIDSIVERNIIHLPLNGEPQELYDPLKYMLSLGGKRVRPRLCLAIYSLFKDNLDANVIYPAIALEIFHSFTLIHDDIMDKADVRRNNPTVHKKWGENIAILSGDVMFIKAYQLLEKSKPEHLLPLLNLFSKTAADVCEGQQFDMNYETMPLITIEEYINMIALKTGALIACAAKMGAIMAGVDNKKADLFYQFGRKIGIAFQITDDYLDTYGDYKLFGKKIGGDIVMNKKSWLLVESFRVSDGEQKRRLRSALAMSGDDQAKIDTMKALYDEMQIKQRAEKEIERYYNEAIESLKEVEVNEAQRAIKIDFANKITYRNR